MEALNHTQNLQVKRYSDNASLTDIFTTYVRRTMFRWVTLQKLGKCAFSHPLADQAER
jgi:hypothetical protein